MPVCWNPVLVGNSPYGLACALGVGVIGVRGCFSCVSAAGDGGVLVRVAFVVLGVQGRGGTCGAPRGRGATPGRPAALGRAGCASGAGEPWLGRGAYPRSGAYSRRAASSGPPCRGVDRPQDRALAPYPAATGPRRFLERIRPRSRRGASGLRVPPCRVRGEFTAPGPVQSPPVRRPPARPGPVRPISPPARPGHRRTRRRSRAPASRVPGPRPPTR
jgi:hypothetical protein